jgi:hypothetical protein
LVVCHRHGSLEPRWDLSILDAFELADPFTIGIHYDAIEGCA